MAQTIAQKILARCAGLNGVEVGQTVICQPDHMLAYEFPGYTDLMFRQMRDDFGVTRFADPERYVIFIDHLVSQGTEKEVKAHAETRSWVKASGAQLYEGRGIGHQVAVEIGLALPGRFLVHFDGHVSGLGALGALGWGVRKDLLEAWLTGSIELEVPASTRFELRGALPAGVDGRDLIHHIIAEVGADGCQGQVMELYSDPEHPMLLEHRQSLCGMAMFVGAVSAVFNPDQLVLAYASRLATTPYKPVHADADASYAKNIVVDLAVVSPRVVLPGSARSANTVTVDEVAGTTVNRAYIGSCASGRLEDLRVAARILRGRKVSKDVTLIVTPTSEEISRHAREEGLLGELEAAGAKVSKSMCDYCFGYADPLQAGDRCISTAVLNIPGRMGSTDAQVYMGSAATVAASALAGRIADPREFLQ